MTGRTSKGSPALRVRRDKHVLYEASVQGAEYDLDFMERVYRRLNRRDFTRFREDFCGTALVAAHWALRRPENHAWGVDLDAPTLAWARAHRLARMGEHAKRVTLLRRDVRRVTQPKVDVVAAYNYSYWVFHQRRELLDYFRAVRRSLRPGGLFFLTAFGGSEALGTLTETRHIAASYDADGERVPRFTYVWEQNSFNVIDHRLLCHIHFRFRDGSQMKRAYTYDWRLWTLPEVREVLAEAGFALAHVYIEGWDEKNDRSDDVYRLRKRFPNQDGWLSIVVGVA
jgi:SAM-dependent methyltransferase